MIQVKLFEIRDRGTFIPVMATGFAGGDSLLFRAAGYDAARCYVIVTKLDGVAAQYDPFSWPSSSRTMQIAHSYIQSYWDSLQNGQVIDVEYILKETLTQKESQL